MVDIRQTQQYANYLQKNGWIIENNKGNYIFTKKIPIVGFIVKIQRPEFIDYKKINDLTKKYKAFQIMIEPKNDFDIKNLTQMGYKISKSPFLPSKTLKLDLTASKEQILKNVKKDARRIIRRETELKIVNSDNNIQLFRTAWKKSIGLKRYIPSIKSLESLKKSFKKNCFFALSETKNAGAIFLIADKTAYYWQAFTNKKGRKDKDQYKIVWEGILWSIKNGAKVFDFEGIYDERFPNKTWLGFTHFKKSFGGEEFQYPGCFVKTRKLKLLK
ncbi:peptidoglycan bridge formation glycyltransferase FemA/FemB family protein [Patescibacteria group bacterium]|nr:peptidoglycan bridge formation glycyltransferase FemA/FemB family protein [Patescibacteria group bacterium]MBU2036219.1 peptidoglycan bridge formation glycyltransferase FemA/FemB family protein [Patescibacteria group bacterium]